MKRIDGNPEMRQALPEPQAPEALEYNPDWSGVIDFTTGKAIASVEPGISYVRAPQVWNLGYTGQGVVVAGATVTTCSSAAGVVPNNVYGYGRLDAGCGVPAKVSGTTSVCSGDFQAAATAVQATSLTNAASNGTWSEGSLNAAGLAALSKTGTTQLRIYFALDDNNDGGTDYIGYYSGENATTANRPQLVITYQPLSFGKDFRGAGKDGWHLGSSVRPTMKIPQSMRDFQGEPERHCPAPANSANGTASTFFINE